MRVSCDGDLFLGRPPLIMALEQILEGLAAIGKNLVAGAVNDTLIQRTRVVYVMIRNGFPPKTAVESIGLPKDVAAQFLQLVLANTPPLVAKPLCNEMLLFIESSTPSDECLAENHYWSEVLAK